MNSARRSIVGWALAMMVIALYTQILLPGVGGAGRGTPAAVLFRGLVFGLINALTAAGIILVYRTLRVINFAQTAIGAAGAILTFNFVQYTAVPFPIAFVLGLGLSALVGVALDLSLVRRFFHAPRLVLTVVTIVVAGFLSQTSTSLVSKLPFFPDADTLDITQSLGANSIRDQLPFGAFHFEVGTYATRFGFPEIFAIEVAVLLLLGLAAFFRFTRSGVAVRAMAENTERAALLGISVGRLSTLVWGLAGVLAGASVTLIGTVDTPGAAAGFAPSVLLPALAAAVVGRMRSLPTTVFAAVGISVVSEATRFSLDQDRALVDLGLLLLIAAGLVLQQRKALRGGDEVATAWQASEEQRPIPKELLAVPSIRIARRVLIAIGLLVVGIFPFVGSTGQTNLGGVIALNAIVALSLVVLTGWAGQVSLGQFAFVAVGGVLGGALTAKVGLTFWLAVPLAAALTAGFAVIVGLPALRIRGLFLAVTTFAFAVAVRSVLFEPRYFDWLLPDAIERPTLFFFDFGDEKSMYFLCVAALVVSIVVVVNVRKSRFGRVLIALRESEHNVAAFGITATRMRLAAFAFSGALAGFSGAIFAHQQRGLNGASFAATASIDIFVLAVLGGIGSVNGALLGSLYVNVTKYFITSPLFAGIVGSGGTLLLLYISPGGLVSLVAQFRDACLRIIAQRRQMVVPSLFADYDPEALERRLIPLAESSGNSGLGALPPDVRFSLQSGLYQGRGVRIFGPTAEPKEAKEAAAIGAAGKRATDDEHHAHGERFMTDPGSERKGFRAVAGNWADLRHTPYGTRPVAVTVFAGMVTGVTANAASYAGPFILQDLRINIQSILSLRSVIGFFLTFAVIGLGWWADRHKRVPLLAFGAIISGFFAMVTSAAQNIFAYGAPTLVGGVAAEASDVPSFSLMADYYPPESRGKVFAVLGIVRNAAVLPLVIAGALLLDWIGWRRVFLLGGAISIVVGVAMLLLLKEPVRGYMERRAMGADEETARQESEPQSFGEAWRTVWAVRTLRRQFIALAIGAPGSVVFANLAQFLLAEEYGLKSAISRAIVLAPPSVIGAVIGAFVGGALIDRLTALNPSRVLLVVGTFGLVNVFGLAGLALIPPLWTFMLFSFVMAFGLALIGPAAAAITTQIIPPAVRSQGIQMLGLATLPAIIFFVPMSGQLLRDYGYTGALLFGVPFALVGAFVSISAASFFEFDRRNAFAASMADADWRRAKAEGLGKMLVCRDVDVDYDGVQVLFGIDFDVEEGQIIALLGTNGAGKSTLLRAISGTQEASAGAIVFDGRDITHMPPHETAARGVIHMPGGRGIFPGLSVRENIVLGNWMNTEDSAEEQQAGIDEVFELFPILRARADETAASLSGGEQQMLSLAQAFLAKPRLLMIDELSLGLSPAVVGRLLEVVRAIHARGTTIIVVEQSVNVALTLAEKAIFMEKGEIKFFGNTADLLARPDILRAVYVKGTGALTSAPVSALRSERERRALALGEACTVLEVENLTKRFGGITAVDGVSFSLREGEVLGIIGPNGSGKTSTFDLISGFQIPDAGVVRYQGVDITELPPEERARRKLVRRFQDARLFPSLTVFETLLVALDQKLEVKSALLSAAQFPQARRAEKRTRLRGEKLIELLELGAYRDKFVKELSTGLRRIVDLACVLATEPQLLLLDEPSSGIAQAEAEGLAPLLRRVRFETGCSILIIEHDMPLISAVSDELIALDQGRFVTRGRPAEVLEDERVVESYLGTTEEAVHRSGSIQ